VSGGVRGTLPWMSPELLNGSSSLVTEKVCAYVSTLLVYLVFFAKRVSCVFWRIVVIIYFLSWNYVIC
jgi:hypothetical protein